MRARDHERVAARRRVDVHEGDRPLALAITRRRQLAGDDLAEHAVRHARTAHAIRAAAKAIASCGAVRLAGEGLLARSPRAARRRAGRLDPERARELVAPHERRAGGPRAASAAPRRSPRARARGGARSRLRAVAARRQPVGDREHRDVGGDAVARVEVAVAARAATSGASCDEEAEPQMVLVSAATCVRTRSAACSRAEDRAGHRARRATSCPGKLMRPSAPHRRAWAAWRCRAGAPRSAALPRVSSSASGSASSAPTAPACSAPSAAAGSRSTRRRVEHLERVIEDVEVVVAALLDAAQRLELGQHDGAAARARARADAAPGRSLASTRRSSP